MENMGIKKTILITGGTGFIGKNITEKIRNDYNLIIISRKKNENKKGILHYQGDIRNIEIFEKIVSENKIDTIIHLATYYKPKHNISEVSDMIDTNVKSVNNILEIMKKYKIKKLINTGTCFEYGIKKEKITESTPLNPWNLYAETKVLAEHLINYYVKNSEIKAITLRLFPPFGIYDNPNKFIPYIISKALKNEEIELTPCEQKWDFIFSEDIAYAYRRALEYENFEGHEIFNIASGNVMEFKKIVEHIIKQTRSNSIVKFEKLYRENEIMYLEADISKAKNILNWTPRYTIFEGINKTINYLKGRDRYGNN
ncbi:hypothetical protein XO12_05880 [Marinitoga sp. 1154]|uniref:NAD-dependent epimerase/dehydratase family protein n=1 Tax=Marinitoga sp. 1154 TaxID=1643335 RepID=UPI001586E4A1|nr:NAD(P)-dependent oxidoreductase [Marinitoga sp. 1154]NUU99644.1 hypothetical protein [Marinitoga sp. 1154]